MNRHRARLSGVDSPTGRKMADTNKMTPNPLMQAEMPERLLPEDTRGAISFGAYRLLASLRRLERGGRLVPMRECEFDLLCTLVARAGEVVSNRELTERIRGKSAVKKAELRFHINALRKALSQGGTEDQYVSKVARRGYRFTAPVSRVVGGGEGNCPLWDGHIIDAVFPPV